MKRVLLLLVVVLVGSLGLSAGVLAAEGDADSADAQAFEVEWSNRLLYEKAMIDEWRKRLERANAAYASAVAEGEDAKRVEELAALKKLAAARLRAAEVTLPQLVAEAREDGVAEHVLQPYRFAVTPADTPTR